MRSVFYVVIAFAILVNSSGVTAIPNPITESQLLSKASPDPAAKRSLRNAGQQVVQSRPTDGNGGVFKAFSGTNKLIKLPDMKTSNVLEAAKKVKKLKEMDKLKKLI
ncbi:secreted RxLR effector peptide protein, putative [Phytophthora infestans T30-4]|uniref:Secreted RxLR effector peptide protein, putative n=1 Tax=Phytophthora infestans (strain T30-4) TaxID=403677 RepID=D0NCG1_PHYIT|nr:secreted RxLR effector peptide protein, putative [Phytophthora infestans T30-4]EEY55675.1 secreted RxLR effector peptide protein, putative [Phytophthora infestans T30-4]|eukprot:XP_002903251.1 secreted RxLR effector peptide protein, putative [Phytophthora infestans T30-4]